MIRALSKYKIIEKLGAGGMGEVYKAEDPALLRMVAIKVLSNRQHEEPSAKTRFVQEARAASAINHPNIVTIYEIGETDDHAYIVMEYVEGNTLRHLITERALTSAAIIKIILEICDAMTEAHSQRIIHRDIKPENIVLTTRGQVKLLDFGLAKTLAGLESSSKGSTVLERLTEPGAIVGTLSYMSPEQLRDETLDERTDLFSFGIVLYEMITGRLPFAGVNSFEVAASILKDEAKKVGQLPADMPPGIEPILMRLLRKDRLKRYPSFAKLRQDVESLKYQPAPETAPVRKPEHTTKVESRWLESARLADAPQPDRRSGPNASASPSLSKEPSPPTILVLPLEPVGSSQDSAFIGIGLSHAITTDLAKISGLSVLSKSAGAGVASGASSDVRELAHELGATILLEGEVLHSGHMIGVMARLIDVETGRVIWGSQYRGDAANLFSIQDAVCESVAAALKISVSSDVRNRMARPATTNIDAFEFYSKGRSFLERRDVEQNIDYAIQMFDEALKLDHNFALAYAGLGEAYWQKYQYTRDEAWVGSAIAASDQALALDADQAQVHVSLGILYHGTGKLDQAISEFERAASLQPMSDDAYKWLGQCFQRKGEMERAVGYFERAIEIRPGYWDNYVQLGYCYYRFGRYDDASEQFRRAIAIQPDNHLGYNNLGGMYYLLGLYQDSVAMYQRAIEIYPNHRSYSNLGTAYFYLERYDEALAAYRAALELDPRNDVYNRNLGDAYLRVAREKEAREQYRLAVNLLTEQLRINPTDALALGRLAVCRAKLQRKDEALADIEAAVRLEPHDTTLMYLTAVVYALTGEAEKAVERLSHALGHGYSRSEAEHDPDLSSLRERTDYKALFSS